MNNNNKELDNKSKTIRYISFDIEIMEEKKDIATNLGTLRTRSEVRL